MHYTCQSKGRDEKRVWLFTYLKASFSEHTGGLPVNGPNTAQNNSGVTYSEIYVL